jgi:hypothetical protein
MPRPVHPKASPEAQEQFKKTSQKAVQRQSRPAHLRTSARS